MDTALSSKKPEESSRFDSLKEAFEWTTGKSQMPHYNQQGFKN